MTEQRTVGYVVIAAMGGIVLVVVAYSLFPWQVVTGVLFFLVGAATLIARLMP